MILTSSLHPTPLLPARRLQSRLRLAGMHLKVEGVNATGTHKDRLARVQVADALALGHDAVTVGTCGNHGTALAFAASRAGLACRLFVPRRYHLPRLLEIEVQGAVVYWIDGSYEAAVAASAAYARKQGCYTANPGAVDHAGQAQRAYGPIAAEIVDALGAVPDAVAVPMGNGTTLWGIHQGFVALRQAGRVDRLPRMIGATTATGNAIVESYCRGAALVSDLEADQPAESRVNQPLVAVHAYHGDLALGAVRESQGTMVAVCDADMLRAARWLRQAERLRAMPASCCSLAALLQMGDAGSRVAVITGRLN